MVISHSQANFKAPPFPQSPGKTGVARFVALLLWLLVTFPPYDQDVMKRKTGEFAAIRVPTLFGRSEKSKTPSMTISAFSNRPFKVKRFQTVHHGSIDVAYGLVLFSESAGGRPGKYA